MGANYVVSLGHNKVTLALTSNPSECFARAPWIKLVRQTSPWIVVARKRKGRKLEGGKAGYRVVVHRSDHGPLK